jgi:serine/threonine protein kinase/tetratricopeptide (TPR) repeat protein
MNDAKFRFPERYTVLTALGGGGGGNVYEVEDNYLGGNLALKLLNPAEDGSTDEEAFQSEFLLSATVSHPSLVKVFDYGYDDGNHPFFTMELAEGDEINEGVLFKSEEVFLQLLSRICSALGLLHHFGYFHNDLKPANIRAKLDQRGPTVKILDFGLTRKYDPSRVRELGGTVEYMAPETFQSGAPSPQSDVYGLGIVLYQLAAGRLPFSYPDPLDVISGHIERDVPPMHPIVPFMNENCEAVIQRMLDKKPERRPRSMAEVLDGLLSALGRSKEEFGDESAVPYFDTAVLQHIRKSPEFGTAANGGKTNVRLGCNDDRLSNTLHEFMRQTLQTRFINVRSEGDDASLTSAHAPETIDLVPIDGKQLDSSGLPESFIVNFGNYGRIDAEFADIPKLDSDLVIQAAMDQTITGHDSASNSEVIARMYGGNLALARDTLTRLHRDGVLVRNQNGFTVNTDILDSIEIDPGSNDRIAKQVEFLAEDKLICITRLAIFNHHFTSGMASSVIDHYADTEDVLDEFVDGRILRSNENTYAYRHEALQRALYERLEPSERKRLHITAAAYLAENEQSDNIERTGMLSQHYLLGGSIEGGIRLAVEYQKLQTDRGEFTKPESLLALCESIYRSRGLRDEKLESELLMSFGDLYRLQGKFDIALEKYRSIIELSDVEPRLLAETYKDLGDIYKSRVEFSEGIEALNHALEIYQKIGDRLEISHTMNNMGNMYFINSEYDLALEKYRNALKIQEALGATKDVASTLSNMGVASFVKGSHDTAIGYFERSIELKKELDDQPEIARTYNNMAAAYQEMGESGRALNYLNQAMGVNREIGAQKELMFNLENIAAICVGLGKYKRAEGVSAEGLAMARRLDDTPHQGVFSSQLGLLYTERGLYGKALEFLEKSMEVSDSITDKLFTLKALLLKARNYMLLNAPETAKEMLDKARRIASPIERDSQLIKLKILDANLDYLCNEEPGAVLASLDKIDKEAEERQFNFEQCESLLLRLEVLASQGRIPSSVLEKLNRLTDMDRHTVFRSFLYFYLGISGVHDRLYREAKTHFGQAEVMATAFEQRELLWRVYFHTGKACMAQLEYEDAFLKLKKAGRILREIAGSIADKELVKSYMSGEEKLELLESVRQLTAKLA